MVAKKRSRTISDAPVSNELQAVLSSIREAKGDGTVAIGSTRLQPKRIPTGIFSLDMALLGGVPYNRTTMGYGKKHSGKTTAILKLIANMQRYYPDETAVFVDVEETWDAVWACKLGVNTDKVLVVSPDTGEDAVDATVALVHAKEVGLVVVDSLAALVPYKEVEGSAEDEAIVGLQSKLITRMMRRITAAQIKERKREHYVSFVVTNQYRAKIGGWSPTGEALQLPGGHALTHFTTVEIHFKNKENIKKDAEGQESLAFNDHAFRVDKNKCNAGIRTGDYVMHRRSDPATGLGEGDIDNLPTMFAHAKRLGWLTGGGRAGLTLSFGDVEQHYANTAEATLAVYQSPAIYNALYWQLIANQADSLGMPDYFIEHLLGFINA
jgi:recombination protein RecA